MVNVTRTLKFAENISRSHRNQNIFDTIRMRVRGGAGGMGYPKYGGIGGKGGDVILEADEKVSLKSLHQNYPKRLIKAKNGNDSHKTCILGKPGETVTIKVPVGISVINDNYQIIGDLNENGSKLIVAKGGPGGCPQTGFSGMKGEDIYVRLDLKLIADIGLVGFPNAGKSTLLKAITDAKPKIASYPFTTIKPNVGVIKYDDLRVISMADLPGLIEGAHRNVGLGYRFLRHCERTKLLLFVVDIQGFQLNYKHIRRTCLETVMLLNKELELFHEFLLDKPVLLVINKMDLPGANNTFKEIENSLRNMEETVKQFPREITPIKVIKFDQIVPISAKTSISDVKHLKEILRNYLDIYAEEQLEDAEENLIEKLKRELVDYGPKLV